MRLLIGALVVLAVCSRASAQVQDPVNSALRDADFRLIVLGHFDAETLAEFKKRVDSYAVLRSRLETGLPPLRVTENADEIEAFERRLAERIRDARGSRRYQLFVPAMEGQIKRLLVVRADPATIAFIMDDGPGEFDVDINETYSKRRPMATMPPNILQLLPDLPRDMEYRFVGRHLILFDVRANIIIDEIPHAIRCDGCVVQPEDADAGDDDRDAHDAR